MRPPAFLLVDPAHFEVAYTINPWMQPGAWGADPAGSRHAARIAFSGLVAALRGAGAEVEIMPGVPGAPDLVFPANAGVVMDGRATAGPLPLSGAPGRGAGISNAPSSVCAPAA